MSEVLHFQRDLEAFRSLDAEIIGVSNDTLVTLQDFADQEKIDFPLVSDTEKEVKTLYGGGRVTYLIDKEGVIRFIQRGVPDNDTFLEKLKLLQ